MRVPIKTCVTDDGNDLGAEACEWEISGKARSAIHCVKMLAGLARSNGIRLTLIPFPLYHRHVTFAVVSSGSREWLPLAPDKRQG